MMFFRAISLTRTRVFSVCIVLVAAGPVHARAEGDWGDRNSYLCNSLYVRRNGYRLQSLLYT